MGGKNWDPEHLWWEKPLVREVRFNCWDKREERESQCNEAFKFGDIIRLFS